MDKEKKGEIARAKQNHMGFWLLAQDDCHLEKLFKAVKNDDKLNGVERKRLQVLEDRSYYDFLFEENE